MAYVTINVTNGNAGSVEKFQKKIHKEVIQIYKVLC